MSCTILTRHEPNHFNCKFCIIILIITIPQWIRHIHVCWHKFWCFLCHYLVTICEYSQHFWQKQPLCWIKHALIYNTKHVHHFRLLQIWLVCWSLLERVFPRNRSLKIKPVAFLHLEIQYLLTLIQKDKYTVEMIFKWISRIYYNSDSFTEVPTILLENPDDNHSFISLILLN